MIRAAAALAIRGYQRWLSPYKGFRCAYGHYHGGASCSGRVLAITQQAPLWRWLPMIRTQFARCRAAYETLQAAQRRGRRQCRKRDVWDVGDACQCVDLPQVDCC